MLIGVPSGPVPSTKIPPADFLKMAREERNEPYWGRGRWGVPNFAKLFAQNCLILNSANLWQKKKNTIGWRSAVLANCHPDHEAQEISRMDPPEGVHDLRHVYDEIASVLEATDDDAGV
jgi:hypothetical protein